MNHHRRFITGLLLVLSLACRQKMQSQMVTGADMPGFAEAFGLSKEQVSKDIAVQQIAIQTGSTSEANVLWPGEKPHITLHFTNKTDHPLNAEGRLELVRYGTSVPENDVWVPHVFRLTEEGRTPIEIHLPAFGAQDVTIAPSIPETFGGYALIADFGQHGRLFASTLVRVVHPDAGRVQFPTYALDTTWDEFMNEGVFVLFEKLGVKGQRMGAVFQLESDPEYKPDMDRLDRYMQWAVKHDVTVMLTLGAGDGFSDQPLGRPRPWLSGDNKVLDTKDDRAWLPQYDGDFKRWVTGIASRYGWPKGNLNAVELWNEPWEATSISGWGADIQRYRDMFTHMALGVEEARTEAGVKVLIGGTCSSSNARDKLFPDGKQDFLKWLDFISIHYQALAADPVLEPTWMSRKNPYGPVRVWDTESWIANSEDRVAGVIASMRAQGQSRTAGIFDGNVYGSQNLKVDGKIYPIVQAWSPAAAVAATQKFIGQRTFRTLLFQNGLPWVFVFDGLPDVAGKANADDGTVVVLGDMSKIYEAQRTLFRSIKVQPDAHMDVDNTAGLFRVFDFYGNPLPVAGPSIRVPLNGRGYFLRTNGTPGSFQHLLEAIQKAHVAGYAPVEIVAHDLTQPLEHKPLLRITLTNVLNRPVAGSLNIQLGNLRLGQPAPLIRLSANETRTIALRVLSGTEDPGNSYPLTASFDAGADGHCQHKELLHVNWIAKRTIHVDGDLSDWKGILPQALPSTSLAPSLTQEAWLPYKDFAKGETPGASTVYLAYDDDNFYFAAKIADDTPDPGMVRFSKRDDNSYFYPAHSIGRDGKELTWPEGVRSYSYRKNFDIPSGSGEHDNVQIAFNVLDAKPLLPNPPGVMPHFITYVDTDYEYALNPVAPEYGGGTEIWRLQAPGIPRKHFFPRQPASPIDGGPVNGKLVIRRDETTRFVEAAIPWSEMPAVHERILLGKSVKFTVRVNDNKGQPRELATERSVSKFNSFTFHDDWQDHWANELEFGVER